MVRKLWEFREEVGFFFWECRRVFLRRKFMNLKNEKMFIRGRGVRVF